MDNSQHTDPEQALITSFRDGIKINAVLPSVDEMESIKRHIDQQLDKQARRKKVIHLYKLTAVAASLILTGSLVFFLLSSSSISQSAEYATTKELTLPDGSKVLLNAHSTIRYKRYWNSWKEREVWLDGEAFFTVTKKPAGYHPKFVVHATGLDVNVVGTRFNVYSRRNRVDVVLEEGKVIARGTGEAAKAGTYSMAPGQMIRLNHDVIHINSVDPAAFTAWKQHRLFFNNVPLQQIVQVLEDNYGYKVIAKDAQKMQNTFTGSCPSDNLQLLFTAISAIYNMQVTLKDNTVTFE